jgi:beta-xylosidase
MAIVARAQYPTGPWENSPYNPLIWTRDESERWWSKGHATLIEGPEGDWFAIYHGYRHGQRSWGRATLISPVDWNNEGWPVLASNWPDGWENPPTLNLPISDEFEAERIGMQWQAYQKLDTARYRLVDEGIEILASEADPGKSNPFTVNPRDLAYEVETEMVLEGEVYAGLILFYTPDAYVAVGLTADSTILKQMHTLHGIRERDLTRISLPAATHRICLKIRNDRQDASYYYAAPNGEWIKLERSEDVSGFQHNVYGSFSSIRPGFFVTGTGKARFEYFRYTALPRQK